MNDVCHMNFASSKGYEKQTGPLDAVGLEAAGSQALGPSLINSAIAITSEDELMYKFFGSRCPDALASDTCQFRLVYW